MASSNPSLPGSPPKPWLSSLRNPQNLFRRHGRSGSGSSSPSSLAGYGRPPSPEYPDQGNTLEPPQISRFEQPRSPPAQMFEPPETTIISPQGQPPVDASQPYYPPSVGRYAQPTSPPTAADFRSTTISIQQQAYRPIVSELADTSVQRQSPRSHPSGTTHSATSSTSRTAPTPKLGDGRGPPAVIINNSNSIPSEGQTQSVQNSQQQIIPPPPQIIVQPPESDMGRGLLDEIARMGFIGFSPLIDNDYEGPQRLFAQRRPPPTQAKDTDAVKAQTQKTNLSEWDTTRERPPHTEPSSTTNSSQSENDPIETEPVSPATPKMKRSLVISTPSPDGPSGTLSTVAPPLSWNPMASPANKTKDVFENLLPIPSVPPLKQGIDSPLVPPITPTHLLNDSSSNIAGTEKEVSIQSQNATEAPSEMDIKPTCSLNLVCYRSGTKGCSLHQIQTAKQSRFKDESAFQKALAHNPDLIVSDEQFFYALRDVYLKKMCGFWRRVFFLKTLRGVRLLSFTPTSRPTIVPLDDFVLQEVLFAYLNPSSIDTDHAWIDWVFRLRQPDRRHALEFVEGWNGTRIAVAGMTPMVLSTLVGIIWSVMCGDVQTAFTVAGFILTAGTLVLALLAIISGIEASGRAST